MKLSKLKLSTLVPPQKQTQVRVFFEDVSDLSFTRGKLRVSFMIKYKSPITGKRRLYTIYSAKYSELPFLWTLDQIQKEYFRIKLQILEGVCPADQKKKIEQNFILAEREEKLKEISLLQMWGQYKRSTKFLSLSIGTQTTYFNSWNKHIDFVLKNMSITDITSSTISKHLKLLTPALWNISLSVLRALESLALQEEVIIHPFTFSLKAKPVYSRQTFLEGKQLSQYVRWAKSESNDHPSYKGLILFQLLMGCRIGEILSLKWSEILDDRIVIPAKRVKTERKSNPHADDLVLPLLPAVEEVLYRQLDLNTEYVFPRIREDKPMQPSRLFQYVKKNGWKVSNTDLRRTMISMALNDSRFSETDVKVLAHHGWSGSTKIYAKGIMLKRKIAVFSLWHKVLNDLVQEYD